MRQKQKKDTWTYGRIEYLLKVEKAIEIIVKEVSDYSKDKLMKRENS